MTDYLEGRHAVQEALDAGVPIKQILIADGVDDDAGVRAIVHLADEASVPIKRVKRSVLDGMSKAHGAHQGVVAETVPFDYATLEDLIEVASGKPDALIIVLDHVQDPGNLGAIARSAEVVGASGLVIPTKRAALVTAVAHKASAGAISHLPIAREVNLVSCLKRLKGEGFWVIGASEKAQDDIWAAPLDGRIVLVMGAEGSGISRLVLETCDLLVKLPQVGKVESLNVAQATTAIAYEWLRRAYMRGDISQGEVPRA